jgi:hypothetical protein
MYEKSLKSKKLQIWQLYETLRLYPTNFKQTKSVHMPRVVLGEEKKKKKETHMSNDKNKRTITIFNVFTIESNKNLTGPNFVLMTIYTHDSSPLVHELNLISVFDFKFTLSIYSITLIAQDARDYRSTQKE